MRLSPGCASRARGRSGRDHTGGSEMFESATKPSGQRITMTERLPAAGRDAAAAGGDAWGELRAVRLDPVHLARGRVVAAGAGRSRGLGLRPAADPDAAGAEGARLAAGRGDLADRRLRQDLHRREPRAEPRARAGLRHGADGLRPAHPEPGGAVRAAGRGRAARRAGRAQAVRAALRAGRRAAWRWASTAGRSRTRRSCCRIRPPSTALARIQAALQPDVDHLRHAAGARLRRRARVLPADRRGAAGGAGRASPGPRTSAAASGCSATRRRSWASC